MKGFVLFLWVISFAVTMADAQLFSLSDTTITFQNVEGQVLTKDEVKEYMKGVFSRRQQNIAGRKVITIIPSGNDQRSLQQAKMDAFIKSLLNTPLRSFDFTGLDNEHWNSGESKGRVLVLNFWFTGCKPCILEMPHLNKLVADNKDSVIFLAPAPESGAQVRKFLKKYNFEYNIIPSSLDYISALDVEIFPTHLVVDKEGIIRKVFIGYANDIREKLQVEIDKLLK